MLGAIRSYEFLQRKLRILRSYEFLQRKLRIYGLAKKLGSKYVCMQTQIKSYVQEFSPWQTLPGFGATKRPPPRSIFGGFRNPKRVNQSKRVDQRVRQQGGKRRRAVLLQGGGLSNARAHPKKYTPKSATSSKASPSVNIWRISKSEVAKSI